MPNDINCFRLPINKQDFKTYKQIATNNALHLERVKIIQT
jgi:hypothetical protein